MSSPIAYGVGAGRHGRANIVGNIRVASRGAHSKIGADYAGVRYNDFQAMRAMVGELAMNGAHWARARHAGRRRAPWLAWVAVALLAVACSGPATGDDSDPTPTASATATVTATVEPTQSPTTEPAATPTRESSPVSSPILSSPASASPTRNASPTVDALPTSASQALRELLPTVAELPGQGYTITAEGTRTQQELANNYADPAAHLQRLTDWGFKGHVYREFSRDPSGPNDPLPGYVLATINVYGSPEQAQAALDWLTRNGTSQGWQQVDAPTLGDAAAALTAPTATGAPTASIYVRANDRVYVYFAEGGQPLDAVRAIATAVFGRL